jgi:hypothetical protein
MKYSEDQIKVSGIKVQGKNAIAVVSSEGTNASSK